MPTDKKEKSNQRTEKESSKKVVILGATGFIGKALVAACVEKRYLVTILARHPKKVCRSFGKEVSVRPWDHRKIHLWSDTFENAYAVINLAGEPVASKRWSRRRKAKIIASRVETTKAVIAAIAMAKVKPELLINASGVGYYGATDEQEVNEYFPRGTGFLADTCVAWEREAKIAEAYQVRVVRMRLATVLGKNGGALERMAVPFRYFLGAKIGSGEQWFPWIHLEDVIATIFFMMENKNLNGPVNLVAPDPVTMDEFCAILGDAMNRPAWLRVPAVVLKGMLGEMSAMLLSGQRVLPAKLNKEGYSFRYRTLEEALASILG